MKIKIGDFEIMFNAYFHLLQKYLMSFPVYGNYRKMRDEVYFKLFN